MANILLTGYISINDPSGRVARIIANRLLESKHTIIESDALEYARSGMSISDSFKDIDVVIVIISKDLTEHSVIVREYEQTRKTVTAAGGLFLPVYMPDIEAGHVPLEISSIQGVFLENDTEHQVVKSFSIIERNIAQIMLKRSGEREVVNEIKEKIEHSAAEYIKETLASLDRRELNFRASAFLWYFLGFSSLIAGVLLAYIFASNTVQTVDWSLTVYVTVKSIFIILLLVAASKYSFSLGKSYMTEALKISDRAHAISFGKFYLQIFNTKLDSAEIKEIFRDWNINDRSLVSGDKPDESFDPMILEKSTKFLEKIAEVVERMRGKVST